MKTVVITGALGGIGASLVSAFRDAHWRVIGTDQASSGATSCDSFIRADLDKFCLDADYRVETLATIRGNLGEGGLQALINNAAVQLVAPTADIDPGEWSRSLRVNLTAPFLLTQGLLADLERGKGSVINIGSIHAQLTKPGFVAYATTKSALEGLTRALSVDIGARVRVNAISPAAIRTSMLEQGFAGFRDDLSLLKSYHPSHCIGNPAEVGSLAVFLASEEGRFLNGSVIGLDGGIRHRLHDPR